MTKKQGMSCRCSRCRVCVTDVVLVSQMWRCHKCRVSVADVSLSQMWCQCHRCVRVTNMSLLLMCRFHRCPVDFTEVVLVSQMYSRFHRCPCHRCRVRVTDVVSVSHMSVSPMSCRCHRCVDSTDVVSVSQTCRCYKCGVDFTDVVPVSQMSCPCHRCRVRITNVVFVILFFSKTEAIETRIKAGGRRQRTANDG